MSVTSCDEIGRGKRGARLGGNYSTEYQRTFRLRTSSNSDTAYSVVWSTLLPQRGDVHPQDAGAFVKELVARETDDPRTWEVDVKYSSLQLTDPTRQTEDPLDEPATFSFDTERIEVATQTDFDGVPIANSAGYPFDPPQSYETGVLLIDYADNVDTVDSAGIVNYLYACNSETFWGKDPYTVLMARFRANQAYRNGISYWKRSMQFKHDPEVDYRYTVLVDMGMWYLDGSGNPVAARDAYGQPSSKPIFLDGSGGKLTGTSYVSLPFVMRTAIDFNDLGLEYLP